MEILPQLIINSLISGSIYALASSGMALTYGLLRILNFAHGHIMMVGAYVFYAMHIERGMGLGFSSVLTALIITLLAMGSFFVFIGPFTSYSLLLPIVTTLSLSIIFESLISIIFGVNVKSLTAGLEIHSIELGGQLMQAPGQISGTVDQIQQFLSTINFPLVFVTPIQLLIIGSAILFLSLLAFIVHSTSVGRIMRALSEHATAAQSLGISKQRVTYAVFVVGTLLAAFAGILVGYETNLQPTMGNSYTIKAFAAMILGGLGNIWGTIAGAYMLGFVENFSIGIDLWGYSIPAGYKDAFSFVIILFVLLFRPQGLFVTARRVT